jgi:hypothetical protein
MKPLVNLLFETFASPINICVPMYL